MDYGIKRAVVLVVSDTESKPQLCRITVVTLCIALCRKQCELCVHSTMHLKDALPSKLFHAAWVFNKHHSA